MLVLYVDNRDADRQVFTQTANQNGWQVSEAKDGLQALESVKVQRPDLIVSEALLPNMDGFELLRAIRSDLTLANLPFVFYTSFFAGQEEKELALMQGSDGFLIKHLESSLLWQRLMEIRDQSVRMQRPKTASAETYYPQYSRIVAAKLQLKVAELEAELTRSRKLEEERELLIAELRQTNHDLQAITEVTDDSFFSLNLDDMLELFLQRLVKTLAANSAAVYLSHDERMHIRASVGLEQSVADQFSVAFGKGVAGTIARHLEPLFLEDLRESSLVVNPEVREQGLISLSAVPIYSNCELLGVVQVAWGQRHAQSKRETRLLEITAERCANAIVNGQLFAHSEEIRRHLDLQIERMPAANIVCDPLGIVQSWNPAAEVMFGFPPAEVIGRQLLDFIPTADRPLDPARQRQPKLILKGVQENTAKDGRTLVCEWFNAPLRKPDNTIIGDMFMALDITEQKKAEEKLRQAQKMEAIGTLTGGIAHDFNNILSAILGYATLVRKKLPEDNRANIDQVIRAGKRASDLILQLLTFSRQTEQNLRPLSMQLIIKEVLKLLRPIFPTTIQIEPEIDESCPNIIADPVQIHQVIMNLCTNAYQAMQDSGGTLHVELRQQHLTSSDLLYRQGLPPGDYLVLVISDTGCGMSRQIQEKIFEPYFTTKKGRGGTGLGLAMVHGIVTNSGGSISVYSEPGKGTTFRVYLPACDQAISAPEEGRAEAGTLPSGTERVLVVDDEPMLAELMRQMLSDLGYEVTADTSSRMALKNFSEQPDRFNLLLTDLTMPGIDGIELVRQVRQIREDLPVILVTGFNEIEQKEKIRQVGIRALLKKPIFLEDLARAVRKALDEKQSH